MWYHSSFENNCTMCGCGGSVLKTWVWCYTLASKMFLFLFQGVKFGVIVRTRECKWREVTTHWASSWGAAACWSTTVPRAFIHPLPCPACASLMAPGDQSPKDFHPRDAGVSDVLMRCFPSPQAASSTWLTQELSDLFCSCWMPRPQCAGIHKYPPSSGEVLCGQWDHVRVLLWIHNARLHQARLPTKRKMERLHSHLQSRLWDLNRELLSSQTIIIIHECWVNLLSYLSPQQEMTVRILASQPEPQEQGTSSGLTREWNTAATANCFWWAQKKECVRRTASGRAKSRHVTVRQTNTRAGDILCHHNHYYSDAMG